MDFLEEIDGDRAVEFFRKRNKEKGEEIDLIIMDLCKHKMDGDIATIHVIYGLT